MSLNIIHETLDPSKIASDSALLNLNKKGDDDPWDDYEPQFSPKFSRNFLKNDMISKVKANKENLPDKSFATALEKHSKQLKINNENDVNNLLLGPEALRNIEKKNEIRNRLEQNLHAIPMKQLKNDIHSNNDEIKFQPKNNTRTLEQFLSEQDRFQKIKEQKIDRLKIQMDEEKSLPNQGKPQLCEKSRKIMEKKNSNQNQQAYERLYSLKRNSVKEFETENSVFMQTEGNTSQSDYTYQPKINKKSMDLVRKQEVTDSLYQDALRRQSKYESQYDSKMISQSSVTSAKTNLVLATKFEREFQNACLELLKEDSECAKIDYVNMNEILCRLGFVSSVEKVEGSHLPIERVLCHEMWKILKGEETEGISKSNLIKFLLALMGLQQSIKKINIDLQESEFETKSIIGYFDQAMDWHISIAEAKRIKKDFDVFYRNRLSNESLGKVKNNWDYKFTPELCQNSRNLADNYRRKVVEETSKIIDKDIFLKKNFSENQVITHPDFLVMQKRAQEYNLQLKANQFSENEIKNCTFTPLIHSNPSKDKLNQKVQRHEELYKLRKPYYLSEDRNALEIEFERNKSECTFQPETNLSNASHINQSVSSICSNNDAEVKAVERMKKGREERNFVKQMQERGIPPPKSIRTEINTKGNKVVKEVDKFSYVPTQTIEKEANEDYFKSNVTPMRPDPLLPPHNANSPLSPFTDLESNIKAGSDEKIPLLFVDVNIGPNHTERIIVYDGDRADTLAGRFSDEHQLDDNMRTRLVLMLEDQIAATLCRIEEEEISQNSEEDSARK